MKKLLIVLLLVCLAGGAAYAQIPVNMDKGDLAVAAGVNFGWDYGIGASVEYMFARVNIADAVPITFGVALRGGVGFIYSTNYIVAGLATAHLSLGFIPDIPRWIKNFDFYYGLGLGIGAGSHFGIGVGNSGGLAYYIKPNLALYSSVIYVRYFENNPGGTGFGSVGLIFKL
ncbi:MAG: hypothetical protein NT061_09000 [Spirochaetes bacterium]|nr:hypothetical protein [Spirochaetota bacterium]